MNDKMPTLFVVGAAKSGTTTICHLLNQHEHVFFPEIKEPHFFCYEEIKNNYYYKSPIYSNLNQYLNLYTQANKNQILGDGTVHYLYYPKTAQNIYTLSPNAKIIIIIRNPIDRAFSHYLMDIKTGVHNNSFLEILKNKEKYEKFYIEYVELGLYSKQIQKYIDIFGKKNVKIFTFEKMKNEMPKLINDILSFTNLKEKNDIDFNEKKNTYKKPNILVKWLYKNRRIRLFIRDILPQKVITFIYKLFFSFNKPKIDNESKQILSNIYKNDIIETSRLINIDLSTWLKENK